MDKNIARSFEEYKVGYIECSECHKKNSRYISESDLLMYFACSATLYTLGVMTINFLFYLLLINFMNGFIVYGLIFLLFVGLFFATKYITYYIYIMAPFKKEWKNIKMEEDGPTIQKRMKWQFIMFLIVALMFGTQPDLIMYCALLLVLFIIIVGIKIKLCLRNEKNSLKPITK